MSLKIILVPVILEKNLPQLKLTTVYIRITSVSYLITIIYSYFFESC